MAKLSLKYHHNVIEHLGITLYQNRPTNVLAELVSNCWDADARNVWLNVNDQPGIEHYVAVGDDGTGMTDIVIQQRYLQIGRPKRKSPAEKSQGGRSLMGRKGIGKLAPFGIARKIDVLTVCMLEETPVVSWFCLDWNGMVSRVSDDSDDEIRNYNPDVRCLMMPLYRLSELGTLPEALSDHIKRLGGKTGTIVLLRELTLSRRISITELRSSLGSRFTIACNRQDFVLNINGVPLTYTDVLPTFELRIPVEGKTTETLANGKDVSFWVGFVKEADWPQDQAGVGVYSHGKLAQDRPFTFGNKGNEIMSRYMYGVIEAEWLDELPSDVVSTNRTAVDWSNSEAATLHEWGNSKVSAWTREYAEFRKNKDMSENRLNLESVSITESEKDQLVELLSLITPRLGKDAEAKSRAAHAMADAWVHKPMREMLKNAWDKLGKVDGAGATFVSTVEELNANSVPESMSLAVTFAQRAYALSVMYELVTNGRETDLQKLIENFPWILDPSGEYLTANESIRKCCQEVEKSGVLPGGKYDSMVLTPEGNALKPDFVFLSSGGENEIVAVGTSKTKKPPMAMVQGAVPAAGSGGRSRASRRSASSSV